MSFPAYYTNPEWQRLREVYIDPPGKDIDERKSASIQAALDMNLIATGQL